ncbi:MAG: GntG family PLP-dependent aldolase [Pirellulaceae bacterium]
MPPIDLRSDTVTQPTPAMREAMARAEVGDDVIDVDPTVDRLQRTTAEILGMEAAIYMPSGTMTNQVAVRIHCKPGDEFLCESGCHIYNYEQGGYAQLSGVAVRPVEGVGGVLQPKQLHGLIRADNEHLVRTRMVCLENTHNRGAGRVQPYDVVEEICAWAKHHGLRRHLDGARLFNAVAASGVAADRWASNFDTVSVCFSKGLGAPVGSALAGPKELIAEARRHRKLFGGGMRQAGVIAAGALYALEHNRERLSEDHATAQIIAEAVRESEHLELAAAQVDTNIVIFRVPPEVASGGALAATLKQQGLWVLAVGADLVRAVTHLHITMEDAQRAAEILKQTVEELASGRRQPAQVEVVY